VSQGKRALRESRPDTLAGGEAGSSASLCLAEADAGRGSRWVADDADGRRADASGKEKSFLRRQLEILGRGHRVDEAGFRPSFCGNCQRKV